MTQSELELKIDKYLAELHQDIELFVKTNAKFKVGDVVSLRNLGDDKNIYVISSIGFQKRFGIVYYGNKIVKSTGEISFMIMYSGVGVPEKFIEKTSIKVSKSSPYVGSVKVKKEEISFIEEHKYFDYSIRMDKL